MIAINPIWGQRQVWSILKRGGSPYTFYYLLRSLDFQYNDNGQVGLSPDEKALGGGGGRQLGSGDESGTGTGMQGNKSKTR